MDYVQILVGLVRDAILLRDELYNDPNTKIVGGKFTESTIERLPEIKNEEALKDGRLKTLYENEQTIRLFLIEILRGDWGMYEDAWEIQKIREKRLNDKEQS